MKKGHLNIRRTSHPLRSRMTLLVISVLAVLVGFLMVNNLYAIYVVRGNAYDANASMLEMAVKQIDGIFEVADNYWVGFTDELDIYTLEDPDSRLEFEVAKARLVSAMNYTLQSYSYIDDLFIYVPKTTVFQNGEQIPPQLFDAAKYTMTAQERTHIRRMIMDHITAVEGKLSGDWECMSWNGQYYLVRIIKFQNLYVGSCASVENLLDIIRSNGLADLDYLTWFENNGTEMGQVLPELEEPLAIPVSAERFTCTLDRQDYLVMSYPSRCGEYSLVGFAREQEIVEGLALFQQIIIILTIVMIIYIFAFSRMLRVWILKPMRHLYGALMRLKDGDLDVRLKDESASPEFQLINETFNSMIENIETLKIDVYEEKARHQKTQMRFQKAELQYMKLQVNPHFYINCLNVIHNLSIMKKNELINDMTTYLGNHLRYTMEGTTVDDLSKEIDYVRNYLKIQELRFPGSIHRHIEIDPKAKSVKVPPLVVQTFVENTVKYQVVAGEETDIYIVAEYLEKTDGGYVCIEIWDSGDGYDESILKKLNREEMIVDDRGEHYGIYNVITRLHLIYGGRESVKFSNHWETHGAYVIIEIPDIGQEAER